MSYNPYAHNDDDGKDRDDGGPPCPECGGWHIPSRCRECGNIECVNCCCEQEDADDFGPSEERL